MLPLLKSWASTTSYFVLNKAWGHIVADAFLHSGDGRKGASHAGPFDAIHVGAAAKGMPLDLIAQLKVSSLPLSSDSEVKFLKFIGRSFHFLMFRGKILLQISWSRFKKKLDQEKVLVRLIYMSKIPITSRIWTLKRLHMSKPQKKALWKGFHSLNILTFRC